MAYILGHFEKYGNVPDKETFLVEFRDFEIVDVHESDRYMIETLREEYLYSQMVPFVHKIADIVKTDSFEAVNYGETNKLR
jgi:hypothetical protein